jgi:CRISPR-associated endonuclease Cas1
VSGRNRHATHPVNAMLNYAYAVLESQVRIATVAHGLDRTIGYLHTSRPGRAALVYDLMEPLHPRVDGLVLDFLQSHSFAPNDFVLGADGVCRLHPQLAKQASRLGVNDLLAHEIVSSMVKDLKTNMLRNHWQTSSTYELSRRDFT